MEEDVIDFVSHFHSNSYIHKECNASFFTLIPKISDPKNVKDFSPISLTGYQYKVIGELLANRLVVVIGSVVSIEQSAFIQGKQILDGPFLLNEIVAWSKASKNLLLIFKVDLEKAYDSLSWDYLMDIMKIIGFRSLWCR